MSISPKFTFVALATLALWLQLLLQGAVADPPNVCSGISVFCFRVTDIRCDDDVPFRYHVEFEVLNWSNALAGGLKLEITDSSDVGVEFSGARTDPNGRPLTWEDIDGDLQPDSGDLEDGNSDGILQGGEDKNGNGRLDNDPIPGNLRRNNTWDVVSQTPTTIEWSAREGGALPFINLIGAGRGCRDCVKGLPQRDGPPFENFLGGKVNPTEWIDNGDNVQDGFVVTIDGMEPGCVAHINWFLTGAGDASTTIEDTPGGVCRVGTTVGIGNSIGTVSGGNAFGFGLISLVRLSGVSLPGPTFQGQTGFSQAPTEFFDGVYNVPDSPTLGSCGEFGMEFTPGTSCTPTETRDSACPKGVGLPGGFIARVGRTTGDFPTINGRIDQGEWDDATIIPLYLDADDEGPSLGVAHVIVDCAANMWFVRAEIANATTRMIPKKTAHFVKVAVDLVDLDGGLRVDGTANGNTTRFRFVRGSGTNDIVSWEASFLFDEEVDAMPGHLGIHAQVATDSDDKTGVLAAFVTQENGQYCVCGGLTRKINPPGSNCVPISIIGGGDPHFSTWSGAHFSFHGECDLVLVSNPAFGGGRGMHVHGRTKINRGGRHEGEWSDMEGVAVKIGNDIFEARGAREYWINGERNVRLPALVGGYQVSLQQLNARSNRVAYVVHLGGEKEIRLKAFDEMMWVQIKGQQAHDFSGSDGLFGHYGNGNMVGRDGTIIEDTNEYGQEWQVRPDLDDPVLFHNAEGPQYPQKCKMPVHNNNLRHNSNNNNGGTVKDLMADENVRLAIAKKACAHAAIEEMDDCVFDVVATHNVEVAEAY